MAATVITIARTLGSQGEEIAHAVSQELGYRYVDDEIVMRASEISGVDATAIEAAEQPRSLITRVVDALATITVQTASGSNPNLPGEVIYIPSTPSPVSTVIAVPYASYESLIRGVISEVAEAGNAVIVAHGASFHLAAFPGVLRCLITASPNTRTDRLVAADDTSESDATKNVREADHARRDYLRRFYDIKDEQPTHYDLVINTDALSLPTAASLIVQAARA